MSRTSIVIMNHTNMQGHHFGCARVMRLIEEGLAARGGEITARLDGKEDWRRNAASLAALGACDAIVINGEGTLHHGRKKAGWLMQSVAHEVTRDKPVFLVNTIFQDNPDSWAPLVQRFAGLYARDARSAQALRDMGGDPVAHFGDLSTSAGGLPQQGPRSGVMIGDSVKPEVTAALYKLAGEMAKAESCEIIPLTTSLREENPYQPYVMRMLRRVSIRRREAKLRACQPLLRYLPSEEAYVDLLRRARLSVTGRFHGVCLNIVTGTPFVCVSSNSWKLEALMEDAGLEARRIITKDQLTPAFIASQDWAFSSTEQANMAAFLDQSVTGAAAMFDAIAGV